MSSIDIIIVCIFLCSTLYVGLRSGSNIKTFKDYAIGNKNKDMITTYLGALKEEDSKIVLQKYAEEFVKSEDSSALKLLLDCELKALEEGRKIVQEYAEEFVKSKDPLKFKLLLNCNSIDINYQNTEGKTLLHLAAADGWLPGVNILIGKGAKLDLIDKDGNTPLDLANGLKEGVIKEAIIKLLTEPTTEVRNSYVQTGGMPATRTAQNNLKKNTALCKAASQGTTPQPKDKETKPSLEGYSKVFNLYPDQGSKRLDKGDYSEGIKVINVCIEALNSAGVPFVFEFNGTNHGQLTLAEKLPDFAEEFFKCHKMPDTIALDHGANKICTDHFNDIISYLIHFMCLAIQKPEVQSEECEGLLKEFKINEQLQIRVLKDLYPNINWDDLK